MKENGDPDKEAKGKEESPFLKVGKYAAAGLEFPSTVVGGLFLGYVLDLYFETFPWLTMVVTILALFGAFFRLIQLLKYFSGDDS